MVHLRLTGTSGAEGWLDSTRPGATFCKDDQGHDVDLALEADTPQMHRWLVGRVPFRELVADGHARLIGPGRLARAFPTWFDMTPFAASLRRAEQTCPPESRTPAAGSPSGRGLPAAPAGSRASVFFWYAA